MPNVRIHILWLLILASLPGGPATAKEGDPIPMTTGEVKVLLSGNSLAGNGKVNAPGKPYDWVAHYASDGTVQLKLKPAWGGLLMSGRWWFNEDGHQCRQFETGHKKEGCWRFQREGKFVRFIPVSGVAVEGRAVMIEGNALD